VGTAAVHLLNALSQRGQCTDRRERRGKNRDTASLNGGEKRLQGIRKGAAKSSLVLGGRAVGASWGGPSLLRGLKRLRKIAVQGGNGGGGIERGRRGGDVEGGGKAAGSAPLGLNGETGVCEPLLWGRRIKPLASTGDRVIGILLSWRQKKGRRENRSRRVNPGVLPSAGRKKNEVCPSI